MARVADLTVGDRVALNGLRGVVECVVHHGGDTDVRLALRSGSSLHWTGANYKDTCKRLKPILRRCTE